MTPASNHRWPHTITSDRLGSIPTDSQHISFKLYLEVGWVFDRPSQPIRIGWLMVQASHSVRKDLIISFNQGLDDSWLIMFHAEYHGGGTVQFPAIVKQIIDFVFDRTDFPLY